ncbi:MAG: hypothetical protein GXY34_15220 [Syntrophomonadaceae bacterium]|nr:hypothetical protein [Syntrophomonadaceae bacterium]
MPLNAAGNPSRPSVSVAASGKSSAALESSRLSPVGIAGHRPPLKLLGKAVPQIVVEFAEPWKSVEEIAPLREWSRLAVAIRTHFDAEYAKRRGK